MRQVLDGGLPDEDSDCGCCYNKILATSESVGYIRKEISSSEWSIHQFWVERQKVPRLSRVTRPWCWKSQAVINWLCVQVRHGCHPTKSETELTASILKKDPKQEIKRMLFNWTKQDRTCKFLRKSSFSSYAQHNNRITNNTTYHVSVGCGRLAEGKGHETDWRVCPFPSASLPHLTDTREVEQLLFFFFFFFYVVCTLKKRTS